MQLCPRAKDDGPLQRAAAAQMRGSRFSPVVATEAMRI